MKIRIRSLFFILALLRFSASLAGNDITDYDKAVELYKSRGNEESLELFKNYIEEYPDSVKADDARWFMGRLLRRLNRDDEAIVLFQQVLIDEQSNRYEEAVYDLSKLHYDHREYSKVITLLSFINEFTELSSYQKRGLELRSMAYYHLALKEKSNYRDDPSRFLFIESLKGYQILESHLEEASDLSRIYYSAAKIYNNLADLSYHRDEYEKYRANAAHYARASIAQNDDEQKNRAEVFLKELEDSDSISIAYELETLAGIDNSSAGTFGVDARGAGSVSFPAKGRSSLELGLSYDHNSFDFVTSNFDPQKTGDARLVQWAELIGLDLDWRTGTWRHLYNRLGFNARYQFAEDNQDNYILVGASEYGSYRINRKWHLFWNGAFQWTTYPNYQSSGQKIDAFNIYLEPEIRLYAADWFGVSLLYNLGIRPYIDSKYDTPDPTISSDNNKTTITNGASIILDISPTRTFRTEVSYDFAYSKSFNYDYWASGLPSDRYVEGYYDYTSHRISLDNHLKLGKRFDLNVDGSLKFTNFLHYPSRDESQTFTDEIRRDITLNLNFESAFLVYTTRKGTDLEALLSGWWDYKVSTMKYNTTIDTNYSFAGLLLGFSIKSQ